MPVSELAEDSTPVGQPAIAEQKVNALALAFAAVLSQSELWMTRFPFGKFVNKVVTVDSPTLSNAVEPTSELAAETVCPAQLSVAALQKVIAPTSVAAPFQSGLRTT